MGYVLKIVWFIQGSFIFYVLQDGYLFSFMVSERVFFSESLDLSNPAPGMLNMPAGKARAEPKKKAPPGRCPEAVLGYSRG